MNFCHLHVHNEFSQLDGLGTADAYAEQASKFGFKYLALTNHGNVDGVIKHQQACQKYGVIPIIGCEAYLTPTIEKKSKSRGHIILLAKNWNGWKNISKMMTFANLEGFYYRPRISHEVLLENLKDIVVGSACTATFINKDNGLSLLREIKNIIGSDLYLEIMPHDWAPQKQLNKQIVKLSKKHRLKIIATNDCHYIKRNDWKAHEVLLAIQTGSKWNDSNRFRFSFRGLHLRSYKEMKKALKKIGFFKEEYLSNTLEVAEKCEGFRLKKMKVSLPRVKNIMIKKEADFLYDQCLKGYKRLFQHTKLKRRYKNRLDTEFNLIKRKRFIRYFLIVWDLINWCNENDIMIGPGRGSVGGSLIAYLLGITDVDPIRFDLLFERFISEDRIDFPDIDIDFEHSKRHLVRKYLEEEYGENRISAVSSFNRMRSKAVVKDVGRVFDINDHEVNSFTKLIDASADDAIQSTIDTFPEAMEFSDKYPEVIKYAKKLEGQIRNYGKHAAAIIISRQPIADTGRCNLIERDGATLVNWEKDDTEFMGLMKLDALALKLLSILSETARLIKENHGTKLVFKNIDLEDKKVLKQINDGNTAGAFQLSPHATANIIKEMGVNTFLDIAAAEALARPGPANSGMTEEYIRRKKRGSWKRSNSIYEKLTKETYGVLVFQEQVISVIAKMSGLPHSTADKIRKIIGKKRDPKYFQEYEKAFLEGCQKEKLFTKQEAKNFWKGLQEWALYGFNKSHSVAYSMLGYWCVWLKYYYPTEFICASLSYCAKNKKADLIEEAYRNNLIVVPPTVGKSKASMWVAKDNKLFAPFLEVKGIGPAKALECVEIKTEQGIKKFYSKSKKKTNKTAKHQGQLGKILTTIGAYDQNETKQLSKDAEKLFEFRMINNPKVAYKRLYDLLGNIKIKDLDKILSGDAKTILKYLDGPIIKEVMFKGHGNRLHNCNRCELRNEATAPVAPSPGRYNAFICGEAPGQNEDEAGDGFVGRSGEMIWNGIGRYKLSREMFHVTNTNKCWPSKSRKPNAKQIKACSGFIEREIKRVKPKIIFALGNTTMLFFTGQKGGITRMSGKITWSDKYAAWICWGMHPAAALHNQENLTYVKVGIKSFCKFFKKMMGG